MKYIASARKFFGGSLAALTMLFFLSSCGTIDGQSAGDIAGKAKDKVGGALEAVDKKATELKEDTFEGLEKKFGPDIIDPDAGLNREDYRNELRPRTPALRTDKYNEPAIPNVSQLLIDPKAPTVGKDKLITLNVTEEIPLKEVLVELARRADIDIELDPNIRGGIIFRAKDKPFSEVIDRICELTGLRYSVINGVLKVERDFPYVENYHVDFLNLSRSNTGGVKVSTNVSSGEGGTESNITSGSQSSLTSDSKGDLWESVEKNITNILANYGTNSPGISEEAINRTEGDDGLGEVLGETPRAPVNSAAPPAVGQPAKVAPPAPPPNKDRSPKVQGEAANASDIVPSGSSLLSVNKQAGVIAVLANQRQHREVSKYLEKIKRQQSAQVLIEAKVVEVTLSEEHRNGIDWSVAAKSLSGLPDVQIGGKFPASPLSGEFGTSDDFFSLSLPNQEVLGIRGLNLDGFIQFAEGFGVTRTLSSPRINAINNQQAVLSFATNRTYYELEIQENNTTNTGGGSQDLNISSTLKSVPLGVILNIQPSINLDTNEITMNVRPTLTREKGTARDPGFALQAARLGQPNLVNEAPIVEVRELDSILKIKSGQVMVIGGLMQETVENKDTGVPYLSNMPFTGNLFKKSQKDKSVVETVIFIKATIVPGFGVDPADKKLYRKFTNDRRPLTF